MQNTYIIGLSPEPPPFDGSAWPGEIAKIACYPWGGDYRPPARAQLLWDQESLYLRLEAVERADYLRAAEPPSVTTRAYQDSCLEFFFRPNPANPAYLNLEFTPQGALLAGRGPGRQNRESLPSATPAFLQTKAFRQETEPGAVQWGICAAIPLAFLQDAFGSVLRPGVSVTGNFYKCGDLTKIPHYGAWNPIQTDRPDFHRPEDFGGLVLG